MAILTRRRHAGPMMRIHVRLLTAGLMAMVVIAGLGSTMPIAAAPPPADLAPGFDERETDHFRFLIQTNDQVSPDAFVDTYGDEAELAFSELSVLFNAEPATKIAIYVYADAAAFDAAVAALGRRETPGVDAVADPLHNDISIALSRFGSRSALDAENALRHATAHILAGIASDFKIPRSFDEGIAQYVERPINPQLARIAGIVQGANQGGRLASWSDLNRPNPTIGDDQLVAALDYAIVAFLLDRYGLQSFQNFLAALKTEPDWRAAMRESYSRPDNEIEQQWRENLPRWVASGWRTNLVAAFDLSRARDLLATGNYAAAKTELERSQRLYTELDDAERLTIVGELISQCDTGIQAEALMAQVQQALDHHTYDRATSLLEQARAQYDQLPPDQRPDELLTTYETLSLAGARATLQYDEALQRSHRWGDYPEAREAAVDAGTTFASLGDEEMTNRSRSLLDDLDSRQRRIVLLLGALAILTIVWLGLWLWARGRSELDWS